METTQATLKSVERVEALAIRDGVEKRLTLREKDVRKCSECGRRVETRSMLTHLRKHHGVY